MRDPLDDIDRAILDALQRDARTSIAALADAVGLTTTPLRARLDKLEQTGVLRGYHADVDPAQVDRAVMAFVHVTLKDHALESHRRFVKATTAMSEVLEVHHIAGDEDFLLKVVVESVRAFESFLLDRLTPIAVIGRVKTTFVLSSAKHRGPVPLRDEAPVRAKRSTR
ncbi:Lrp/AsnC family transcriptional regulator [Sandaracinus amylolyticus]|uniref:Transcriptional regulator, AsnC family protein n=1 Tax=Sandaracinus amylolyticus TaxID=927083 RepID=A0A0F6VZJ4_9BACT|nr:Lrp/AsnC family transcriptional regulator [Sandaracinus amylolyticus]AKF03598.1 Transcriptional regulator, AsnC family protein [Sandaracinus amylolyticus]